MAQRKQTHWSPAWVAAAAALGSVAVVLAEQSRLLPLEWWGFPFIGLFGAGVTVIVTVAQGGWLRTHAHRTAVWLGSCGWVAWATLAGWTQPVWLSLISGGLVLGGLAYACRTPGTEPTGQQDDEGKDRRPVEIRQWEALLRRLTRAPVRVTAVVPWDSPDDGERVHVELPSEGDITADNLVDVCRKVAVARRLPPGCGARVLDGDHQGAVVLDVMLRDCLTDSVNVPDDYTPASVYDTFQVMTTPRGESLDVCLRSQSMVIGGAPDSGKTTLLHRIIMWLARCTDCLIWVVDTNGGGVATPWVRPWAQGRVGRPVIDWVADSEEEAAVLVAVATAVAKDRKTSPEAVRRRHAADTTVLPVDEHLPAIVVLNDEGGEMRQAVSVLGQVADQGISRLAQIGRAEAVRAIKSVLRGTADLLDKGLRVCAALRICLRVEEEDEYVHVLGSQPGKTKLLHKGTGYIRRPGDPRPILGRTVNVLLSQIERAAVACSDLRPDLDERGQRVAAKVRLRDVLGGRDPDAYPDIAALPVMEDVQAGRAYSGRWDRFASRLAAMRGEDLPEVEEADEPATSASAAAVAPPAATGPVTVGPAVAALAAAAGLVPAVSAQPAKAVQPEPVRSGVDPSDQHAVDGEFERIMRAEWAEPAKPTVTGTPVKMTTREYILAILTDAYPTPLMSSEIGAELRQRDAEVARTHRQDVLRAMLAAGEIARVGSGYARVVAK